VEATVVEATLVRCLRSIRQQRHLYSIIGGGGGYSQGGGQGGYGGGQGGYGGGGYSGGQGWCHWMPSTVTLLIFST
jgi:hypothetical protein